MTISTFQVGDLVRLGNHTGDTSRTAFLNAAGTATDPTAVLLTVRKPDGTTAVYAWPTPSGTQLALTKEATGRFYADVSLALTGVWSWELAGTGAVETAEQSQFRVARRWVA